MQRILFDKIGTNARQVTFRCFTQTFVEQCGHRQIENGIAEKLQSFVVICRETSMRDGSQQELICFELMPQSALQRDQPFVHATWSVRSI